MLLCCFELTSTDIFLCGMSNQVERPCSKASIVLLLWLHFIRTQYVWNLINYRHYFYGQSPQRCHENNNKNLIYWQGPKIAWKGKKRWRKGEANKSSQIFGLIWYVVICKDYSDCPKDDLCLHLALFRSAVSNATHMA